VQALFRELISLTERQPPAADVKLGSLLLALLGELFASRHYPVSVAMQASSVLPYSFAVRKAIDRITAYYDWHTHSVKDIASLVGQSLHYFTRRFHREVGMSPKAYLNQYRIEQAKSQLESSEKTIEQIARSVGFRDQNYFTRQFKKIVKVSPREYRRIHQKHR
jgi:two-component system response regulator YesN